MKPILIKPVQTAAKGLQDRKNITLYKGIPKPGEELQLGLMSNAGVNIGYAELANSKYLPVEQLFGTARGGFEVIQNGEDRWNIRFARGDLPRAKGTNPDKLKASYTVKLNIWPAGTYLTDRRQRYHLRYHCAII